MDNQDDKIIDTKASIRGSRRLPSKFQVLRSGKLNTWTLSYKRQNSRTSLKQFGERKQAEREREIQEKRLNLLEDKDRDPNILNTAPTAR